jgi:Domain of unknown function (DUF6431)
VTILSLRRYQCCACGATVTVIPAGVLPFKHYSAPAIVLALALFGVFTVPVPEVRRRVSPWRVNGFAATGWQSLFRWIEEARRGALISAARSSPTGFSRRQVAERVGMSLAAVVPQTASGSILDRAFAGASFAM